jgi:hypothetical protein
MSVAINAVTQVDSRNFIVSGSTSPGQLTVTCQAFIGAQPAGPANSGQSGTNGAFSVGVSLDSDVNPQTTYTFRATDQKDYVAESAARFGPVNHN